MLVHIFRKTKKQEAININTLKVHNIRLKAKQAPQKVSAKF